MENQRKPLQIKFLEKPLPQDVSKKLSYFFQFINIYLSLDFGFLDVKSFVFKVLFKMYLLFQSCFIVSIGMIIIYLSHVGDIMTWWYLSYYLQYLLYVFILMFSRRKTLKDFIIDLYALDSVMEVENNSFNTDIMIIVGVILINIYRISSNIVVCVTGPHDCIVFVIFYLLYLPAFLANDIIMAVGIFIFHSVSRRMRKFTKFVCSGSASIVSCEYMYKNLADTTDDVMNIFQILFSSSLIFFAPAAMIAIVILMSQISDQLTLNMNITMYTNILFVTSQSLVLIVAVAIFGGKLASEVETLRFELMELLENKDQRQIFDLKRFVRYVEVRPFKYMACQTIPIDYTLPFTIINLCITYIIIVIQFSHYSEK